MELSRNYLGMLKWVALIGMIVYHFSHTLMFNPPATYVALGRIAFPIFGFILGYNIAQSVHLEKTGTEQRLMKALLACGCFAQPFYWNMTGHIFPLNIMFTLALGTYLSFHYKSLKAVGVLVVFGLFVDYAWIGAAYVLMSYLISTNIIKKQIEVINFFGFATALVSIAGYTHSYWPLLTLPLLVLGFFWKFQFYVPRAKWFFYAIYPLHLIFLQFSPSALYPLFN